MEILAFVEKKIILLVMNSRDMTMNKYAALL